jgi:hypothetical protein
MVESKESVKLERTDQFDAMRKFEEVCGEKVFEGEQELEDITEELFSTLGELKGC